jgi:hypothetical protein
MNTERMTTTEWQAYIGESLASQSFKELAKGRFEFLSSEEKELVATALMRAHGDAELISSKTIARPQISRPETIDMAAVLDSLSGCNVHSVSFLAKSILVASLEKH